MIYSFHTSIPSSMPGVRMTIAMTTSHLSSQKLSNSYSSWGSIQRMLSSPSSHTEITTTTTSGKTPNTWISQDILNNYTHHGGANYSPLIKSNHDTRTQRSRLFMYPFKCPPRAQRQNHTHKCMLQTNSRL